MKKIILAIIVLLISFELFGQNTLGIRGGYGLSWQSISNWKEGSIRVNASWLHHTFSLELGGMNIGPYYSHKLSDKFKATIALTFSQKGQNEKVQGSWLGPDVYYLDRINYLTLPIEFTYTRRPNKKVALFWTGGLYLARGIGGSTTYKMDSKSSAGSFPGSAQEHEGEVYFRSQISSRENYDTYDLIVKPWDLGGILGLGIKIKNVPVSLTYQGGFIDVHPKITNPRPYSNDHTSNERIKKNISFFINVGVPIKTFD